ncbi:hypothetical protein RI367_006510 [Sorochytrium milnesiophthora]
MDLHIRLPLDAQQTRRYLRPLTGKLRAFAASRVLAPSSSDVDPRSRSSLSDAFQDDTRPAKKRRAAVTYGKRRTAPVASAVDLCPSLVSPLRSSASSVRECFRDLLLKCWWTPYIASLCTADDLAVSATLDPRKVAHKRRVPSLTELAGFAYGRFIHQALTHGDKADVDTDDPHAMAWLYEQVPSHLRRYALIQHATCLLLEYIDMEAVLLDVLQVCKELHAPHQAFTIVSHLMPQSVDTNLARHLRKVFSPDAASIQSAFKTLKNMHSLALLLQWHALPQHALDIVRHLIDNHDTMPKSQTVPASQSVSGLEALALTLDLAVRRHELSADDTRQDSPAKPFCPMESPFVLAITPRTFPLAESSDDDDYDDDDDDEVECDLEDTPCPKRQLSDVEEEAQDPAILSPTRQPRKRRRPDRDTTATDDDAEEEDELSQPFAVPTRPKEHTASQSERGQRRYPARASRQMSGGEPDELSLLL